MRSSRYRSKLRDSHNNKIKSNNSKQEMMQDDSPIKIDIDGGWDMTRLSTDQIQLTAPSV